MKIKGIKLNRYLSEYEDESGEFCYEETYRVEVVVYSDRGSRFTRCNMRVDDMDEISAIKKAIDLAIDDFKQNGKQ